MRVVVLLGPGDNWIPGQTVYEQGPSIVEHLEAMRGLYGAGTLLLGGPFIDSQAGIAVLEVPDAVEATHLMELDPAVQAGVLTFEAHRLRTYFDALGLHAGGRPPCDPRARPRLVGGDEAAKWRTARGGDRSSAGGTPATQTPSTRNPTQENRVPRVERANPTRNADPTPQRRRTE